MGLIAALRAASLVRRAARRRAAGDAAAARALAARARAVRPNHVGGRVAEALAACAAGDAEGALAACEGAPDGGAIGLLRAMAWLDRGDAAAARAALGAPGGNRVRAAYLAVAGLTPGGPWPDALAGEIPGAPHLRARVLCAAEGRLALRESAADWAQGYLDVVLDAPGDAAPAGPPVPPGATFDDAVARYVAREWGAALATLEAPEAARAEAAPLYRGACLLRLGRAAEAADALAAAAAARPRDYLPVLLQGAAALLGGDPAAAGARFEAARRLFPVAGELWYHAGLASLRGGDAAAARQTFERLVTRDEIIFRTRCARAAAVARQGSA